MNECRLLAKASREHFINVAHEADFILSRVRSLEVRRQTAFRVNAVRRQRRRIDELDNRQSRRLEAGGARDMMVAANCLAATQHLLQCLQHAPLLSLSIAAGNHCDSTLHTLLFKQMRMFLERTKR